MSWLHSASWLVLAASVLFALGGAARTLGGVLLGVPPAAAAAAGVLAAVLLAWRSRGDTRVLLGLAPLGVVAFLPWLAGARAFSGPITLGLAASGLVLLGTAGGWRPPRRLLFPFFVALYLVASIRVQQQVGPQGDEPHYLMVADSLIRDGDLALDRDYAEKRYEAFVSGPLEPHYRARGRGGEIISLHAVGLSLLILPAYAAGGYPGASFFMAFLAALLVREIRSLIEEATGESGWANTAAWAAGLSPPIVHFAGLVFTEIPAALVVAFALRRGRRAGDLSAASTVVLGSALVLLPWLNIRYGAVAFLLGIYVISGRLRRRALSAFVLTGLVGAGALVLYHQVVFGFWDPRRVYGRRLDFSLTGLAEGLPGLLLDQEFGLLVYAPLLVLGLPGLVRWAHIDRRPGIAALALVGVVLITAGSWHMWRGGFNPPARFLVPVVAPLCAAAAIWARGRLWAAAAVLAGWSLFAGLAGAAEPRFIHRDRDGTAPFFRAFSGAEEWTRLLPAYVLAEPDRGRLAILWTVVLVVAAVPRRSPAGAWSLARSLLALLLAAEGAARLSDGRTGGRDAVRTLGRSALECPPWRWMPVSSARWTLRDLGWGPLYEPHRHPSGAPLGERLFLAPGLYRFDLDGELYGEDLGRLVFGAGAGEPFLPAGTSGGAYALFALEEGGSREVSLSLAGGSARTIRSLNLSPVDRSNPLTAR